MAEMTKTLEIAPVSRIEGHAKITIHLDGAGAVEDAKFHVTQFRGFERFVVGRPFQEMPSITARICGICPVSHLMASAKACDDVMAVRIPKTAVQLREMMNLAQMVQSHALSFFHLSSPDFLLGMDSDPAARNVFGLIQAHPDLAKDGIQLRKIGQSIIAILGQKRIHPAWVVPGGVNAPLTEAKRDEIAAMLPEALEIAQRTAEWFAESLSDYQEEVETFGNFPSLFMGLVDDNGAVQHYEGKLRFVNANREIVKDGITPGEYDDYIGEQVEPHSYLKSPYYKPMGYPEGIYRVGPLARLNIADSMGTPLADKLFDDFRAVVDKGAVLSSFQYHYARLVEIVYGLERIQGLVEEPDILSTRVRAHAGVNSLEGIGISEAPRGTLIHHYKVDENGLIEWANLIVATGHNNLAMNKSVKQVAQHFVKADKLEEGMLNRVEAVIRAYDPCLSCSTHAVGQMPLHVQLIAPDGEVVDDVYRD